MKTGPLLAASLILGTLAQPARAHFLFARILPPAEGGRAIEVYFSELAEAGDARFIDKIAHTQLWLQQAPNQFEPLIVRKTSDRLHAHLPTSGSLMVVGHVHMACWPALTRRRFFCVTTPKRSRAGRRI